MKDATIGILVFLLSLMAYAVVGLIVLLAIFANLGFGSSNAATAYAVLAVFVILASLVTGYLAYAYEKP